MDSSTIIRKSTPHLQLQPNLADCATLVKADEVVAYFAAGLP